MDVDALRALDAVVREGGVARAAARLNRVQSAVSYQVGKLEAQVGTALLDRSGYRVRLTPAGEVILAEGRKLLAQADHMQALADQFASGWEPRLTVVVDGVLPLEPVLTALKTMTDEDVPTSIRVRVEFLRGVQQRFEAEGADFMLVKDLEAHPDLEVKPLRDVECVLCVGPPHALASRKRVDRDDLQRCVELSIQDSGDQGDDRHMFGSERVVFFPGFVAKKQALAMGLGFGWMPAYMVEDDLASGALSEVRYDGGSRYSFRPYLVRRNGRPLGRAGLRLASLIEGSTFYRP
jgi:DNA-binding transcriptional LysR family regulator